MDIFGPNLMILMLAGISSRGASAGSERIMLASTNRTGPDIVDLTFDDVSFHDLKVRFQTLVMEMAQDGCCLLPRNDLRKWSAF